MKNNSEDSVEGGRLDRFGAVASSLCAVHCALCAFLPAAFAALGLGALLSQEAEWGFTIIAILFAGGALVAGWRVHRSSLVVALLSIGIVGLLASRVIEMGGEHHHHDGAEQPHADGDHHSDEEHGDGESEESHSKDKPDDHSKQDDDDKAHADAHEDGHGDGELMHLAGSAVGIFAGLLLLVGHITNLRATRQCRADCCDDETTDAAV